MRIIITARDLHPHRLIVITLGAPAIVKAALTTAVEMTKTPEQRRSETPIFLSFETRNCHRIGTGMVMMRPSVRTFRMTRTQKFWGRNVQRWLGSGRTTQLLWNLEIGQLKITRKVALGGKYGRHPSMAVRKRAR